MYLTEDRTARCNQYKSHLICSLNSVPSTIANNGIMNAHGRPSGLLVPDVLESIALPHYQQRRRLYWHQSSGISVQAQGELG